MRLVAFPYHDWRKADVEGNRWRDAHILEGLGRHAGVETLLVVDRPTSLAERMIRRSPATARGRRVGSLKVGRAQATLTEVAAKTIVLDIAVPDLIGPVRDRYRWWFSVFEDESVLKAIEWAVASQPGSHWSSIAWTPTVAPAIERLNPRRMVFDSLDNWLLHPQLRRYADRAAPAYQALLRRADAVFVSAPRSRDALRQWDDEIEVLPNGVSPELFEAPTTRPADLPDQPIVGYAGSIGARIDEDLVRSVARGLPGVQFVFIGQALDRSVVERLGKEPNVNYLGDRHYSDVPAYIRSFDVAWIPHAIGAGESGGDPIKMYEYWAAGREVVATRIDGLDRWADRLHLVTTAAEAVSVIQGQLSGSVPPLRATVPPDRTWEAMTQVFVDRLGEG